MSGRGSDHSSHRRNTSAKPEIPKHQNHRDVIPGTDLWTDGLICAFEYVRSRRKVQKPKTSSKIPSSQKQESDDVLKQAFAFSCAESDAGGVQNGIHNPDTPFLPVKPYHLPSLDDGVDNQAYKGDHFHESRWVPIGWTRISELVQEVEVDVDWESQQYEFMDKEDDVAVAELAAPYWERPVGPVWWCHVDASHPNIISWFNNAQWLHPAVSVALRDESRLISERMKYLLYEVIVYISS